MLYRSVQYDIIPWRLKSKDSPRRGERHDSDMLKGLNIDQLTAPYKTAIKGINSIFFGCVFLAWSIEMFVCFVITQSDLWRAFGIFGGLIIVAYGGEAIRSNIVKRIARAGRQPVNTVGRETDMADFTADCVTDFIANLLWVVVGLFWLIVSFSFFMLIFSFFEESLPERTSLFHVILAVIFAILWIYAFVFVCGLTWTTVFSRFFREEVSIDIINKLGFPPFMRNYFKRKLDRRTHKSRS